MTFEEMQEMIEGMLAVQKELQISQINQQQKHDENFARIEDLISELAQVALKSDKALLERIESNEERIEVMEERIFPEQN
jgi:hypothetical protein